MVRDDTRRRRQKQGASVCSSAIPSGCPVAKEAAVGGLVKVIGRSDERDGDSSHTSAALCATAETRILSERTCDRNAPLGRQNDPKRRDSFNDAAKKKNGVALNNLYVCTSIS